MRILFLMARFPWPPDRGDRVTTYHLLRTFASRHTVTLVTFTDGSEPEGGRDHIASPGLEGIQTVHLPRLRSWVQAWAGLAGATPSQVRYYRSARMMRTMQQLVAGGHYDVVFGHPVRMAPFIAPLDHPCKVVFLGDSHGLALSRSKRFQPRWRQLGIAWEARRMARYEASVTRAFRESWVLSPVDAAALRAQGAVRVEVVTEGMDERLYALPSGRCGHRAMFLGNMGVPHNVDAVRYLAGDIWPRVRGQVPDATLDIVGADPAPSVKALDAPPSVRVRGRIEDLMDGFRDTSLLVAPLRFSTGIQTKVLEAMAAGVPVVTRSQVAAGIGAEHSDVVLVGDSDHAFADLVVDVMRQPERHRDRIDRARAFVRERFRWDIPLERLEFLASSR